MCSPVAGGARLTDTLATTTEGEPLLFQSKAGVIPHLNMAVAITGIANFGASWNEYLRSSLIARDLTWWLIGPDSCHVSHPAMGGSLARICSAFSLS